jgi:hypothetical protein
MHREIMDLREAALWKRFCYRLTVLKETFRAWLPFLVQNPVARIAAMSGFSCVMSHVQYVGISHGKRLIGASLV